jgi:hypothetical protein
MLGVCILLAMGQPAIPIDPPTDMEVIAALSQSPLPLVEIVSRGDISITKAIQGGVKVGPRLFYPGVGHGQLVEATWKCEVAFRERVRLRFPFPVEVTVPRQQIVEIPSSTILLAP